MRAVGQSVKYTLVPILTTRTPVSVCVVPSAFRAVEHADKYLSTYSKLSNCTVFAVCVRSYGGRLGSAVLRMRFALEMRKCHTHWLV